MAYDRDTFITMIDPNGYIRDMSAGRCNEVIGIDTRKEQEYIQALKEQQDIIDNYYNKLVELGAIELPKTPEQIAQEAAAEQLKFAQEQAEQQAKINESLLKNNEALFGAIEILSAEIKELKSNGYSENVNGSSGEKHGNDSQSNRTVTKPSKSSVTTRAKNVT